ncbi:MAG: electron transport complex subunit RsxC [Lachnospiraceae bacterium]|jgi:electron transport complex protein RnfC|nr:electron transport complex subunit RsxC [Lachnospiraceae bacterium]
MSDKTFVGGIHPYDGKDLSKDKPIRVVLPNGELVYPLAQHIGAPATPIVSKGDKVLAGQRIAAAVGFVSAPIYATVSGTVKAIEPRRVVTGDMVMSIIIENDGLYDEVDYPPVKPLAEMSRAEIVECVKEAGIVGMGGAGFPTFIKLSPPDPDAIRYVCVNCAECEPYLTSDYRRILEETERLIGGLRVYLALFPKARGIFAVEDNKPDCIKLLKELIRDEPRMSVTALKTKYPQGAERQLIYAVTGRAINSSMLPADVGCVVSNVDTVITVNRAVNEGKPMMYRVVTVTGDAIVDPVNFIVRIGTNYNQLLEEAGGFRKKPAKVISGGPMMGFALFDTNVPTTKTASALLCLTADAVADLEPTACINCGKCAEVCPGRVLPSRLAVYADHGREEEFLRLNGMECCECGCCSYVCPAKRHLTQSIKSMRKMQLAKRKKEAKK